ncbi:MAG: hypothetical protein ISS11_04095 [Candidatus Marinimicrobia bacterium]|nr:hypothetical protein [Candidatus Neomarinimicrobiota bacterium]
MISVAIFTFKRFDILMNCINSLKCKHIGEILIFNDDEEKYMKETDFNIEYPIRVFNPADFGYKDRIFRKPKYMNLAIELIKFDKILFTDDDGLFAENTIDLHYQYLKKYEFVVGSIIRDKWLRKKSKTILQGTNYSFHKKFFIDVGGYNEEFIESSGGGDPELWYRIYNKVNADNLQVAFLSNALQTVISKTKRVKNKNNVSPKEIFENIHGFCPKGPMYRWFPNIRNKTRWMDVIE